MSREIGFWTPHQSTEKKRPPEKGGETQGVRRRIWECLGENCGVDSQPFTREIRILASQHAVIFPVLSSFLFIQEMTSEKMHAHPRSRWTAIWYYKEKQDKCHSAYFMVIFFNLLFSLKKSIRLISLQTRWKAQIGQGEPHWSNRPIQLIITS